MGLGDDQGVLAGGVILGRHDERHRCGVPAVSLLVGPVAQRMQAVEQWSESIGRQIVLAAVEQTDKSAMVTSWVDSLASTCNLPVLAVHWLARLLDWPAVSLERSLCAMRDDGSRSGHVPSVSGHK